MANVSLYTVQHLRIALKGILHAWYAIYFARAVLYYKAVIT